MPDDGPVRSRPVTRGFNLRALVAPIYIPTLLFAAGQGFIIPIIPLYADDLGAGVALVGLIVASDGIGSMLADVPAGVVVGRLGGRAALLMGAAGTALFALLAAASPNAWLFGAAILLSGTTFALWQVSRLSWMSDSVPVEYRGRALSLVGGVNRIGMFISPWPGGLLAEHVGYPAVFVAQAIVVVAAGIVVYFGMDPASHPPAAQTGTRAHARILQTLRDNARGFATTGMVAVTLVLSRRARRIVFPLWGDHIGLGADEIGLIFTVALGMEMLMFLPVGIVMDRFGRKWTVVPCLVILSLSLIAVPVTHSFAAFALVGFLSGLGNGLGTGAVMTLGSDLAPRTASGEFLGVWRLVTDSGNVVAPIAIGGLAQVVTLGAASVITGGVGFIGAAIMVAIVAETLTRDESTSEPARGP